MDDMDFDDYDEVAPGVIPPPPPPPVKQVETEMDFAVPEEESSVVPVSRVTGTRTPMSVPSAYAGIIAFEMEQGGYTLEQIQKKFNLDPEALQFLEKSGQLQIERERVQQALRGKSHADGFKLRAHYYAEELLPDLASCAKSPDASLREKSEVMKLIAGFARLDPMLDKKDGGAGVTVVFNIDPRISGLEHVRPVIEGKAE